MIPPGLVAIGHLLLQLRNRLLTLLTLEQFGTLLLIAPCLLVNECLLNSYLIVRGQGRMVWNVLTYFCRRSTWRIIVQRRREIRGLRQRRDMHVVQGFASRLVFAEIDSPVMRYVLNPLLAAYWALVRHLIVW